MAAFPSASRMRLVASPSIGGVGGFCGFFFQKDERRHRLSCVGRSSKSILPSTLTLLLLLQMGWSGSRAQAGDSPWVALKTARRSPVCRTRCLYQQEHLLQRAVWDVSRASGEGVLGSRAAAGQSRGCSVSLVTSTLQHCGCRS